MADEAFDEDPEQAAPADRRTPGRRPRRAIGDLRSVVRGIHPPVLADRGLAGAVAGARARHGDPGRRSTRTCPAGRRRRSSRRVYFAVAECLANVGKHSGAGNALDRPRPRRTACCASVVGDDGRGGADPQAGTGMLGVMRRLAAFDGTMSVSSPTGGPTIDHPGGAVRLVLAEDHALLRDGLIQLLEANGFTILHAVDNAPALERALLDPDADAAVARRTDAADAHRRGPARRDRGPRRASRVPGDGPVAVRRAALRPRAAGRAARARSATCSRTGSPTSRSSSTAYAGSPPAAPSSTPRWWRPLMAAPARRAARPADRRASARCSG